MGGQKLEWTQGDIFLVPRREDAILFSMTDRLTVVAAGLYREDTRERIEITYYNNLTKAEFDVQSRSNDDTCRKRHGPRSRMRRLWLEQA